ncbi:MAG: SDR family oxidoreductase, partial [Gemmatimonas sp.]
MSTFLVIGAGGNVGSEVSRLLEAAGHTVRRATSRQPGPGQVPVNLVTGEGLRDAVAGADGVFLLSPPGHTNQDQLLGPVVDAAKALGVHKVVLLSAM